MNDRDRADAGTLDIAILIDQVDRVDVAAGELLNVVAALTTGAWGRCSATGCVGTICFDPVTARIVDRRCRCGKPLERAPSRPVAASVLIRNPAAQLGARGHVTRIRRWLDLEHNVDVQLRPDATDDEVVAGFARHDVHLAGPVATGLPGSVRLATAARIPSVVPAPDYADLPPWIRATPVRSDLERDGSTRLHAEIGPAAGALVELSSDHAARAALGRRP